MMLEQQALQLSIYCGQYHIYIFAFGTVSKEDDIYNVFCPQVVWDDGFRASLCSRLMNVLREGLNYQDKQRTVEEKCLIMTLIHLLI